MSETGSKRPLSPHLSIYKPQISSVMSIFHRASGVFMAISLLLVIRFFTSLASGEEAYQQFVSIFNGFFGSFLTLGLLGAYFYHLCNGVRHLFWDAGCGFRVDQVDKSGKAVFAVSILTTLFVWLILIF